MKKTILTLTIITSIILVASPGFSQEASPTATPSAQVQRLRNLRQLVGSRGEEATAQAGQIREAHQAQLTERKRVRVRSLYQLMRRRLLAAITRLENIITRMEERITLMGAEGIETQAAQELVDQAKLILEEIKDSLEAADEAMETAVESSEPLEEFKDIRTLIQEIRLSLIEVKQLLQNAVNELRGQTIPQNPRATQSANN